MHLRLGPDGWREGRERKTLKKEQAKHPTCNRSLHIAIMTGMGWTNCSKPNTRHSKRTKCHAQKQNEPMFIMHHAETQPKDHGYKLSANFHKPPLLHVGQVNSLSEKSR